MYQGTPIPDIQVSANMSIQRCSLMLTRSASLRLRSWTSPMTLATLIQVSTIEIVSVRASLEKLGALLSGESHWRKTCRFVEVQHNFGRNSFMVRLWRLLRSLEHAYIELDYKHQRDISKDTGCHKPCKYQKYKLDWEKQHFPMTQTETEGFGLWAISNYTMVGKNIFLVKGWIFSGWGRAADLPLAISLGWIWRGARTFSWILLHDYLGVYCLAKTLQTSNTQYSYNIVDSQ